MGGGQKSFYHCRQFSLPHGRELEERDREREQSGWDSGWEWEKEHVKKGMGKRPPPERKERYPTKIHKERKRSIGWEVFVMDVDEEELDELVV